MSIHLKHGYRLPNLPVRELNTLIHTFQSPVELWARAAYQHQAAVLAYRICDLARVRPSWKQFCASVRAEYTTAPTDKGWRDLSLRHIVHAIITDHHGSIAREQCRDPDYDWGCTLSVIPHRTGLYTLLYAEASAYFTFWESCPSVQEYAYYNSTDRPDHMSAARWKRRAARWDDVLGDAAPADRGLTVRVYEPLLDWRNRFWAILPAQIPDAEARVRHWAFAQAVQNHWEAQAPAERGFSTVFEVERWIRSDAASTAWADLQAEFRAILPAAYDDAVLRQSLRQIWAERSTETSHASSLVLPRDKRGSFE